MKDMRNSSLELLRIICMFFIMMLHYSTWGGVKEFSSYEVGNGLIFVQIIGMYAKVSCAIFAMMTGFFLINAKKEGYYKKLVPMVEQIYFYSYFLGL